jgi:hypothetical protein
LKGSRNTSLGNLVRRFAARVVPVQQNGAARGLVYVCQKVENRRLSRAVRAD